MKPPTPMMIDSAGGRRAEELREHYAEVRGLRVLTLVDQYFATANSTNATELAQKVSREITKILQDAKHCPAPRFSLFDLTTMTDELPSGRQITIQLLRDGGLRTTEKPTLILFHLGVQFIDEGLDILTP